MMIGFPNSHTVLDSFFTFLVELLISIHLCIVRLSRLVVLIISPLYNWGATTSESKTVVIEKCKILLKS